VARNALFGVALLAAVALSACGEAKEAEAATAQVAALRARTDSLRQVRTADSAAQATLAATPVTASADDTTARKRGQAADSAATQADAEAALSDSVQKAREIEVMRETFAYAGGARDPFASLVNAERMGPEIADLDLVGVYQDLRSPSNSVVVLREKGKDAKRHKMRVGDQLGRARLSRIRPRDAVFMINDFGYERQETLSLRKQEVETP
jgi:multidrug efflux pump subunit AcrA (membrane-fusion protein)